MCHQSHGSLQINIVLDVFDFERKNYKNALWFHHLSHIDNALFTAKTSTMCHQSPRQNIHVIVP